MIFIRPSVSLNINRLNVENMESGLDQICAAMLAQPSNNRVKGIAIYAYWDPQKIDEEE